MSNSGPPDDEEPDELADGDAEDPDSTHSEPHGGDEEISESSTDETSESTDTPAGYSAGSKDTDDEAPDSESAEITEETDSPEDSPVDGSAGDTGDTTEGEVPDDGEIDSEEDPSDEERTVDTGDSTESDPAAETDPDSGDDKSPDDTAAEIDAGMRTDDRSIEERFGLESEADSEGTTPEETSELSTDEAESSSPTDRYHNEDTTADAENQPDDEEIEASQDEESNADTDDPSVGESEDLPTEPSASGIHEPGDETVQPDRDSGLFGASKGPAADEEMPITDHVEEMVKRLIVVIAVAGIVSVITFPFAESIINFLWNSILPANAEGNLARPRLYSVLELWFTKVKVASLAGLIIALPVLVYEAYRFMRPGLYPHERRYYLAAVPMSLVLALVGVAFAYFIVLPSIFTYFLYYSRDVATIGFALGRTFNLILIMMAYLAIVFQIPLFLMLAMMMNLVTRQWLADRRLLFWGAFLGISFIFSPDPTGMVPILVASTMVGLFEATLLLTKWTQRRRSGGKGVTA